MKMPEPKYENGQTWGRWKLDTQAGTLDYYRDGHQTETYSIRLFEIDSNGEMLAWLYQLEEKAWVTLDDLGNLVKAFCALFDRGETVRSPQIDAKSMVTKKFK